MNTIPTLRIAYVTLLLYNIRFTKHLIPDGVIHLGVLLEVPILGKVHPDCAAELRDAALQVELEYARPNCMDRLHSCHQVGVANNTISGLKYEHAFTLTDNICMESVADADSSHHHDCHVHA